jgi:hypothetical protein
MRRVRQELPVASLPDQQSGARPFRRLARFGGIFRDEIGNERNRRRREEHGIGVDGRVIAGVFAQPCRSRRVAGHEQTRAFGACLGNRLGEFSADDLEVSGRDLVGAQKRAVPDPGARISFLHVSRHALTIADRFIVSRLPR